MKKIILLLSTLILSLGLHAHSPDKNHFRFTENKGQWDDQILYKSSLNILGDLYIVKDGLVYNMIHPGDWEQFHEELHDHNNTNKQSTPVRHHAYKVKFENANLDIKKVGHKPSTYYQNYFIGNDPNKWASNVRLYEDIKVNNIYTGIDLAVYRDHDRLKYDFIVAPNANPNNISLSFDGVTPKLNEKGSLILSNTINTTIEEAPVAYQIIDGKKIDVPCHYDLIDGKISFAFPQAYNKTYELVIDPLVVFSTYSGATSTGSAAYSHSSTNDEAGNMYAVAYALAAGWPTNMGAYQVNFAGGTDVGINKFNDLGNILMYSTYFGGSSSETPLTSRVNSLGQLLIGGMTSSSDLPMASGAFKATKTGGSELFLAILSADGTQLLGSTYYGNTGRAGYFIGFPTVSMGYNSSTNLIPGIEVNFDANNNIWFAANVEDGTNIPTTSNAFQLVRNGGFDVVVTKFNPTLNNVMYGTYFGGSGDECVHGIELLPDGNPIIVGGTTSTNLPMVGTSQYQSAPRTGSTVNGFAAVLNETSGQFIHSTYISSDGINISVRVDSDKYGNIFVLGRNQNGAYPIDNLAFTNVTPANDNATKLTVTKFNSTLSQKLISTAIHGSNITPGAFIVDECSNIYFTSMMAGANMPLTVDAFQRTTDDLWFAALDGTMQELIFGTYYGDPNTGDHCHTGTNRFDKQGRIYHSICVSTNSWPTTPGSYAPVKLSGSYDVASFKFDFDKSGVSAVITPDRVLNPIDSGCVPHTVNFDGTVPQARRYFWDFGDGNTSTSATPTHTYLQPGLFNVMLVVNNDSLCITHDTAYLQVRVYEVETPILRVVDTNLCKAVDSLLITVEVLNPSLGVPGNVFRWTGSPGSIYGIGNTQSVWVNPNLGSTYNVTVLDSVSLVCTKLANASLKVNMQPRELEILTPDTAVCKGSIVPIRAIGNPEYSYRWSPTLGVSDTTSLTPTITINQSNVYMVTASYPYCIDTSDLIYITMHEYPVVDIIAPSEACEKSEINIRSNVTPYRNDYTYNWEPSNLLGTNTSATSVAFIADTVDRYYKLTVTTPIGCSGTDSAFIVLHNKGFGDAIAGAEYCPPNSAQLWAANGVSYQWIPSFGLNDPNIANPITNTSIPTTYQVLITDTHNCIDTLNVIVDVYPRANLSIPDTAVIFMTGEGYQVAPNTNAMYFEWFPPSGVSNPNISDPILNPTVNTRYFVTAKTEYGCEVKDSISIIVGSPNIQMPNAFNPNNRDASLFKPLLNGGWTLNTFKIYNRWGQLLFETTDIKDGWDGAFKNTPQPFGVYVWQIDATDTSEQKVLQTGNVTLIR